LYKNKYPKNFVDNCIKTFLDKKFSNSPTLSTVSKKEIFISLPFLGKSTLSLRTRLKNCLEREIPFCKLKIVFTSKLRLSSFFNFKDKMPKALLSKIVYKFSCGSCNASYYGKTFRHFKTRASEHAGISHLTGKSVKNNNSTAIKDHMLECDHVVTFQDFSAISTAKNNFHLEIKESLLISRDKPILNRNISSLPLYLFN
jgi:Uri superfamily endonuclease